MNRHVNAIAGRLSLRAPQRRSLEVLDRITAIAPPKKDADIAAALEAIRSEFPSVTDFEHEFPSLCFALATRVALRGTYKGKAYRAALRKDGRISHAGVLYDSPGAACRAIVKRAANGWAFWRFRKGNEWVRLRELRKG